MIIVDVWRSVSFLIQRWPSTILHTYNNSTYDNPRFQQHSLYLQITMFAVLSLQHNSRPFPSIIQSPSSRIYHFIILQKAVRFSTNSKHFSGCHQLFICFYQTFHWLRPNSKLSRTSSHFSKTIISVLRIQGKP